jgi:hypothetical protein
MLLAVHDGLEVLLCSSNLLGQFLSSVQHVSCIQGHRIQLLLHLSNLLLYGLTLLLQALMLNRSFVLHSLCKCQMRRDHGYLFLWFTALLARFAMYSLLRD